MNCPSPGVDDDGESMSEPMVYLNTFRSAYKWHDFVTV